MPSFEIRKNWQLECQRDSAWDPISPHLVRDLNRGECQVLIGRRTVVLKARSRARMQPSWTLMRGMRIVRSSPTNTDLLPVKAAVQTTYVAGKKC
jgi:hypothetical protein